MFETMQLHGVQGNTCKYGKISQLMFYKLQFVGEPIQVNKPNVTELQILFDSPSILIEKEELAYSSLTLVSDVGGVLGLFIGFNFLMIFDWIVLPFKQFFDFINKLKI